MISFPGDDKTIKSPDKISLGRKTSRVKEKGTKKGLKTNVLDRDCILGLSLLQGCFLKACLAKNSFLFGLNFDFQLGNVDVKVLR